MKRHLLLVFFLFAFVIDLFSQVDDNYRLYMENAGRKALVYSGKLALKYPFKYEGTFFAYGNEYLKGELIYNSKHYRDIYLNLNSYLDEVCVKIEAEGQPIVLCSSLVSEFYLGDKHFVRLVSEGDNGIPSTGFYEIAYQAEGQTLFRRIEKVYEKRIENQAIAHYFNKKVYYYLQSEGYFTRVKKKKELKKYLQGGFR